MATVDTPATILGKLLSELHTIIQNMPADYYTNQTSPLFESTIGAHVRHSLDHIRILLDAYEQSNLQEAPKKPLACYDIRKRGTGIETNRAEALSEIQALQERLRPITDETDLDQEIQIKHMLDGSGQTFAFDSNLARELFFVAHHMIHHNAIIKACLKEKRIDSSHGFGVAPSTQNYMASQQ